VPRIALTRPVSESLARCELTYLERAPIDLTRARAQHAEYENLLASIGLRVEHLAPLDDQPDAVFVEDAALALDELAIVAPMGAASRAGESASVAKALERWLPVHYLTPPATLDGGDVLRIGRRLYVGCSRRTNTAAVEQLAKLLLPHNYEVVPVAVTGALHLKSACSFVGDNTLLANPEWLDLSRFAGMHMLSVDTSEAWGASVLYVDGHVVMPAGFPRTRRMLATRSANVHEVELSELRKAEGGPTCLSIILPPFVA